MKTIYFDNNATTKVADEVLEEMKPFFCKLYGNPSSMHTFGGQISRNIRTAREQVAALLGCVRPHFSDDVARAVAAPAAFLARLDQANLDEGPSRGGRREHLHLFGPLGRYRMWRWVELRVLDARPAA